MRRSTQPITRSAPAAILAACSVLAAFATAAIAGERTPSDLEREEFLRRAEIGHTEIIPVGITKSLRATLTLGDLTHDAHIQIVDTAPQRRQTRQGSFVFFHDSYKYNIVAYRLDRLVGLDMVPVSVERRYRGKQAAVTWWIDGILMTDAERFDNEISPPDVVHWTNQKNHAWVFHQLVANEDPNLGNFLVGEGWRLWLVDFTRAFQAQSSLPEPHRVRQIDRRFYDGLRGLTLEELQRATAPHLSKRQARSLLARRDAILEILAGRIEQLGEAAVIRDPARR